jgi:hypothetical protein
VLNVTGNVSGDGSETLDEVTNGSYTSGGREYDIIRALPGSGFSAMHTPFANYSYSGSDPDPLPGGLPWNHSIVNIGGSPASYYYELTN